MHATLEAPDEVARAEPYSEDRLYEVVNGVAVEKPATSRFATGIAFELAQLPADFADRQRLGYVDVEALFRLPTPADPRRSRRPDVAFTSFARWPADRLLPREDNTVDVIPDQAIEIVSPTNRAQAVAMKVREYFDAGVPEVWVIDPVARVAQQWRAVNDSRTMGDDDSLEGGSILPWFSLRLGELLGPARPFPQTPDDDEGE